MTQRVDVADRFVAEVLDRVRLTHLPGAGAATAVAIASRQWPPAGPSSRAEKVGAYFALCERAWLIWSRHALDSVTIRAFHTASLGIYNPSRVRNADEAAAAHSVCSYHRSLLEAAPSDVNYPHWPVYLERALQVHVATQQALMVASTLDAVDDRAIGHMYSGIAWAADALVTAFAAGFIANLPSETCEAVDATLGCSIGPSSVSWHQADRLMPASLELA